MGYKPIAQALQGWYGTHDIHTLLTFNTPGTGYSEDVIIEGQPVHRVNDISEPHFIPPPIGSPPHPETVLGPPPTFAAATVHVNGQPAAFVGAQITGSAVVLFKPTFSVFASDGMVPSANPLSTGTGLFISA